MPSIGSSFNLLDWGSLSRNIFHGKFAIFADGVWNTSQLYTSGVVSVTIAGDYNADGAVDAADYVVWRADAGRTQDQFDAWRAYFGQSIGSGAATNSGIWPICARAQDRFFAIWNSRSPCLLLSAQPLDRANRLSLA